MDTLSYKTISVNKATAQKEWVVVDATGQSLGRIAAKVAKLLRGKYKPSYTPHVDCGDNVIIINAEKVEPHLYPFHGLSRRSTHAYPGRPDEERPQIPFPKGGKRYASQKSSGRPITA